MTDTAVIEPSAGPERPPERRAGPGLRSAVLGVWRHRYAGPALKLLLAYLLLIEGGVQIVFGRLSILGLQVGTQDHDIPRAIFLNGASIGLLYALLGMGLILVYRANRIINFAQAQLGSVPAVTALLLMLRKGVNYFLVLPIVIIGAIVLGIAVDALLRRFRNAPRMIVTAPTSFPPMDAEWTCRCGTPRSVDRSATR